MPFTFSHPAIVLPLTLLPRRWCSLTGLVVGSLTPDFEYFLRMKVRSEYSHTVDGMFWFDLPFGLFLAFLFHNFVKDSLFNNLPQILKARLTGYKEFNWNSYFKTNWPIIAISVVIGSASHLVWDSFTHEHGYFVGALPSLAETVEVSGIQSPIFKILQHSSTLIGGVIIAIALYRLPTDSKVNKSISIKYWVLVVTLTSVVIVLRILSGLEIKMYGHLIATAIAGLMFSLLLAPLLLRQKNIKR